MGSILYMVIVYKMKIQSDLYGDIQLTLMNIEKHRNYITTFRVDDSFSSLYAASEDVFVSIGKGEGNGKMKETLYKMDKVEANLLKNFMYVKNMGMLFNKCNVDVNGKPTIVDPDTNRPISKNFKQVA